MRPIKTRALLAVAFLLIFLLPLFAQEEGGSGVEIEAKAIKLVGQLNSRFVEDRRTARSRLEAIGPSAVKPLLEAIKSEIPGIRAGAALVLGRMHVNEVVPELLNLLDDPSLGVRRKALEAVGGLEKESASMLQDMLKGATGRKKDLIEKTLGRILQEAVAEYLRSNTISDTKCMYCPGPIEELKKLGPGVLEALKELSDWNHHGIVDSYYALNAIGDLGDPAAKEFLIKKYKEAKIVSSSMVCRAGAAMSLSKLGESKYADELIRDMNQGVYTVSGAGKHSSLGATYLEMGKLDEAEKEFKEAKKLDSSEISYTFRLACVYALKGDSKKTVDYLKEIMAKDFVKASKLQRINYFKKLRESKDWKEFIEPELKKEKEQEEKEAKANDDMGMFICPRCKKTVLKTATECPWCMQRLRK